MNYWSAETTNLDVSQSLFDYMEVNVPVHMTHEVSYVPFPQKTWAPRGAYTAEVLYNITRGWVTHNEVFLSLQVKKLS